MRREWIEIMKSWLVLVILTRSPSMRREWIEIMQQIFHIKRVKSPSMRREWIEITSGGGGYKNVQVSLHAEGVD